MELSSLSKNDHRSQITCCVGTGSLRGPSQSSKTSDIVVPSSDKMRQVQLPMREETRFLSYTSVYAETPYLPIYLKLLATLAKM